jgi:hypothetical protein
MAKSKSVSEDRTDPGAIIAKQLGIDLNVWDVRVGYSKGVLSSARGAMIEVTHMAKNRTVRVWVASTNKAATRRKAAEEVQRIVRELS